MSRIAFLGTPGAAVPTLQTLAEEHDVAVVITQPDRPRGRSGSPSPPLVKVEALQLGLTVEQPTSAEELEEALAAAGNLELAVVVAYGRLLRPEALTVPLHGMLNVHFSLLPRWRGAAPVARALLAGDPMTGVTLIKLDEGLDTGPVVTAQAIDIGPHETSGELTTRLAHLGARLVRRVIPGYLDGELEPVPQSNEGMTYAAKIEAADRPLDVEGPSLAAVNRVRALSPEPGATLAIDQERVQVLDAIPTEFSPGPGVWVGHHGNLVAGFGDGGIELTEIKPPGRNPMTGAAWLRGRNRENGKLS